MQHLERPVAVPDDQQVGTSGLSDKCRASRSSDYPLLHLRRIGRNPRQRGSYDLGEFTLGPCLLLGNGWHPLSGDRRFPSLGQYRCPAADRTHLSAGAAGVRQGPPQRRVAGRGTVNPDYH
jgi:hypothetical protein